MRVITVGFACNNACVFCAQGDLRRTGAAADDGVDAAATAVTGALSSITPGETVAFAGGEPTLHPDLCTFIREAHARGAGRIVVQTNGRRLAYLAFMRALAQASPRLALDVSLHGATAPMHDWHTGTEGSFAQTLQGLRHARAERVPAGVTVVVTRSNYRHLAEIVRVAHASGAVAVHLAPVEPFGRALGDASRLVPPLDLALPHLRRAAAEAARLGLGFRSGDRGGPDLFAGLGVVEPPPAAGEQVVEEHP
jgi:MoaA/NifB/PqqE/SkfB family radical SAM enzyme